MCIRSPSAPRREMAGLRRSTPLATKILPRTRVGARPPRCRDAMNSPRTIWSRRLTTTASSVPGGLLPYGFMPCRERARVGRATARTTVLPAPIGRFDPGTIKEGPRSRIDQARHAGAGRRRVGSAARHQRPPHQGKPCYFIPRNFRKFPASNIGLAFGACGLPSIAGAASGGPWDMSTFAIAAWGAGSAAGTR